MLRETCTRSTRLPIFGPTKRSVDLHVLSLQSVSPDVSEEGAKIPGVGPCEIICPLGKLPVQDMGKAPCVLFWLPGFTTD